jgi:hypothetical protein
MMNENVFSILRRLVIIIRRFSPVFALFLLAAMVTGCDLPPHVASLDEILEHEGISSGTRYGYRCTAGAHRGASEEHRENTMAALRAADRLVLSRPMTRSPGLNLTRRIGALPTAY